MKRLLVVALALLPAPALAQFSNGVGVVAGSAVAGGLIVRAGASSLYDVNVVSGASAGYVLVFDSATIPADGAVTPKLCLPLAANTGLDVNLRAMPMWMQYGATVAFSTTGCFTKTVSATAFIAGSAQ